jgi:hypothetical protein
MLLVGLYGDCILGGDKYDPAEMERDIPREVELAKIEKLLGLHHNPPVWRHIFDAGLAGMFEHHVRVDIAGEYARSLRVSPIFSDRKDHFFLMHRGRRYIGEACLESFFLRDAFLFHDYDLVRFLFALPRELRARHGLYNKVLTRAFPALARIPWQRTGAPPLARPPRARKWRRALAGRMRELTRKASAGGIDIPDPAMSTDFDRWYRVSRVFRQFVRDTLLDPRAVCRSWYTRDGAERLLRWQGAGKNYSFLIARLLTLELYWRGLARRNLDREDALGRATLVRGKVPGGEADAGFDIEAAAGSDGGGGGERSRGRGEVREGEDERDGDRDSVGVIDGGSGVIFDKSGHRSDR